MDSPGGHIIRMHRIVYLGLKFYLVCAHYYLVNRAGSLIWT